MKLRNKKTGAIKEVEPITIGGFRSLAELNEEWEDYEGQCWYITSTGEVREGILDADWRDERRIGNYFETKEEAEKAVEKLKAWKRLKDKGFRFTGWDRHPDFDGDFRITASDDWNCDDKDLDLLFRGEE